MRTLPGISAACAILLACGPSAEAPPADGTEAATQEEAIASPQDRFWASLRELCGRAFPGEVVESVPPDTSFADRPLIMHVRECGEKEIRIPFHVGEDRSRTWVLTRTEQGLRLKHDHRHEDGSPDELTDYGGETPDAGSAARQEFAADSQTATMLPAAATNVWTLEIEPSRAFAYALRREGSERRFRAEFDLTRPVEPPPPPWGS